MTKSNIIIRKDNIPEAFFSEDSLNVIDILENNYSYIYDSIKKEEFILKYGKCDFFKEIVYDEKVVGFCSYDFSREFLTYALNNVYVLPKFRGKGLFINELKIIMEENNKPSIVEPTRFIVELLIKYDFAIKVNDNIVASAIEFITPCEHVFSNTNYVNRELTTHFYDLSISGSIHVLDLNKGYVAYSLPLNDDIMRWNDICEVDEKYISDLVDFFKNNEIELMNSILKLEDSLSIKKYTLEEVIRDGDNFSHYIESLIDDAHVTHDKALEIKNQIREEYEAGMILNESLLIRLAYLFNEYPQINSTSHNEACPWCNMPIDNHDRFCHFCGINLNYKPHEVENDLINSLNFEKSDFIEDIEFIAYKFLRLIENKIEIEYSIFTIENNYGIEWVQLSSFLDKNQYFKDRVITNRGYQFLNSHPLNFFEKYHMDAIDYTDFEKYFYKHSNLNPIDVCLNYLNQFGDDKYVLEIIDEIKNDFH